MRLKRPVIFNYQCIECEKSIDYIIENENHEEIPDICQLCYEANYTCYN